MTRFLGIAAVIVCLANSAMAQTAGRSVDRTSHGGCSHTDDIVTMANRVLDRRGAITGFAAANYGSDAIYYLLHYGDLDLLEVRSLFKRAAASGKRPPRQLESLERAYFVSKIGGQYLYGASAAEALSRADMHLLRAMLTVQDGAFFFETLKDLRARADLDETFTNSRMLDSMPHMLLRDQSDAFRAQLADRALAAGELTLAAQLLATLPDLSRYFALIEDHSDDDSFLGLAAPKRLASYGTMLDHHKAPPMWGTPPEPVMKPQLFTVFRAGYLGRQLDILNISLNYTGKVDEISRAATKYLAALEAGQIEPRHDAEATWAFAYQAMIQEMGISEVTKTLEGFNISTKQRHFSGSAQQLMDWVMAKRAIAGFVTGTADAPDRPSGVSAAFDWLTWVDVAIRLRTGERDFGKDVAAIAVEMHLLRGDVSAALALAETLEPAQELGIYRDVMRRLDRRCKAVSETPGQAILLGGEILYRF